jgi:hypothetical protein
MKSILTFCGLAAWLGILAAIAIGVMVSISRGQPSGLLIAVLVIDTLALLVIGGALILHWRKGAGETTRHS